MTTIYAGGSNLRHHDFLFAMCLSILYCLLVDLHPMANQFVETVQERQIYRGLFGLGNDMQ